MSGEERERVAVLSVEVAVLEPITTHREGGWIATGRCGRPHLVGRGWSWWRCPVCPHLRARSRDRINAAQARLMALYYPTDPSAPPDPHACPHCDHTSVSANALAKHRQRRHKGAP